MNSLLHFGLQPLQRCIVSDTLGSRFVVFKEWPMLIVHVHVQVKPDQVEAFRTATLENAQRSVSEPGVARFDVIQQQDDPTRFVLVEVYRTKEDPVRHKETAHYQKWRDTVAGMMAGPRKGIRYSNIFPGEDGWDYAATGRRETT
jgi:autoinducer 2-degrading protein